MEYVKLGDICEIINGYAFKSKNYVTSGIRIIRITNVQKGFVEDTSPVYYPLSTKNDFKKYILYPEDLLISLTGNVGRVAILDKKYLPAFLNQRVACIRLKSNKILKEYLFYMLNTNIFEIKSINSSKGIAQKNISTEWLNNYLVPLPNLEIQQHIVTILNKLRSAIKNKERELSELDELIKARFVEMFGDPIGNQKGWETQTLEQSCSQILGGGTPSKVHSEYFNGNIPWVTPKDMKTRIIIDSKDHITREAILRSSAKLIPANSVLMVIRSGILKHTLPVAINKVKVTMNQDMKAFVPNLYINSIFLENYFRAITPNILSKVRSVTADNINFKEFRKRKVLIPPLSLQNEFANFVQQVDKSKVAVQKSLDETQRLFDSLMQEYFG